MLRAIMGMLCLLFWYKNTTIMDYDVLYIKKIRTAGPIHSWYNSIIATTGMHLANSAESRARELAVNLTNAVFLWYFSSLFLSPS